MPQPAGVQIGVLQTEVTALKEELEQSKKQLAHQAAKYEERLNVEAKKYWDLKEAKEKTDKIITTQRGDLARLRQSSNLAEQKRDQAAVSYTHLTLPTKRIV